MQSTSELPLLLDREQAARLIGVSTRMLRRLEAISRACPPKERARKPELLPLPRTVGVGALKRWARAELEEWVGKLRPFDPKPGRAVAKRNLRREEPEA